MTLTPVRELSAEPWTRGGAHRASAPSRRQRQIWQVLLVAALAGLCQTCGLLATVKAEPVNADLLVEDETKNRDVAEAIAKFNAGKYAEAEEMLKAAVKKYPGLSPAHVMLARLFLTINALGAARSALEKEITLEPNDPEAYEMLGNMALVDRRITEAGMLFDKVLELVAKMEGESKRKKNLLIRGQAGEATVAESRAQWEKAKTHLTEWIALDTKNFRPHMRLAQTLFQLDQANDAYKEFQEAAKLSAEQELSPEVLMGRMYQQAGSDEKNREKAAHWMNLAIETSPKNLATQIGVAEWNFETGNLDEAKKHAELALELKPDAVEARLIRGLIARYSHDYAEAEKQFESAYLASQGNFTASNQLALTLAECGDKNKLRRAIELAELNARQSPNNPEAATTLGAAYIRSERFEEAARALQSVLSTGTVSGDAAYYVGQLFAKRNQPNEARRFLRAALDSKGPFAHREAAQALYDQLDKGDPNALSPAPTPSKVPAPSKAPAPSKGPATKAKP